MILKNQQISNQSIQTIINSISQSNPPSFKIQYFDPFYPINSPQHIKTKIITIQHNKQNNSYNIIFKNLQNQYIFTSHNKNLNNLISTLTQLNPTIIK